MEKDLTFSAALVRLKKGDQIARANMEKGMHLELDGDQISFVEPNGDSVAWIPKHEDLLAEDWTVTKEAGDEEDEDDDEETE